VIEPTFWHKKSFDKLYQSSPRKLFIGIVTRRDILTFYQQFIAVNDNEETFFNPTIKKIMSRRSIRKYTNEQETYEHIETIVDAGLAAPTAANRKPVHILILQEQEKRNELYKKNNRGRLIAEATAVIAVYGDTSIEESEFLLNNDCSAAIQNMLIAIEALGLGGVWISAKDEDWRKLVSETYQVPKQYKLYGMIAFGHPNEVKEAYGSADPNKVHFNKW
jgi:nitroreductase